MGAWAQYIAAVLNTPRHLKEPLGSNNMYLIRKQFHFSASHQLDNLPPEHPCARLHGHNYIVEIVLQAAQVDERGFVVDYLDLKPFKHYIDDEIDHRHLNDLFDFPTSAENIAKHLFDWAQHRWAEVIGMRVSETPKTWAEFWRSEE